MPSHPRLIPIVLALASALVIPWTPIRAETLEEALNEATSFLQEGDYDKAIEKYREAIKLEPGSSLVYNLLGMAYRFRYGLTRQMAYKKEEIAAFEKAIELDETYWVSYINLGNTHYHMGQPRRAAPYFKRALELYPDHPERPLFEKILREAEVSGGGAQEAENTGNR